MAPAPVSVETPLVGQAWAVLPAAPGVVDVAGVLEAGVPEAAVVEEAGVVAAAAVGLAAVEVVGLAAGAEVAAAVEPPPAEPGVTVA